MSSLADDKILPPSSRFKLPFTPVMPGLIAVRGLLAIPGQD